MAERVNGRAESNFGEPLRGVAVAGLGTALHATWHVADDLRAGHLQVVLPEFPLSTTGVHAIKPSASAWMSFRSFDDPRKWEARGRKPPERTVGLDAG